MDIDDNRDADFEDEELLRLDALAKENAADAARKQKRDRQESIKTAIVLVGILVAIIVAFVKFGSGSGSGSTRSYDAVDFSIQCEAMVAQQLKAPRTAQFQGSDKYGDGPHSIKTTSSGFHWLGFVDAQNSFGALLRTSFVCTYDMSTGSVKANVLN